MNVFEKRLDEIKPYENNPRINDGAVKFVKKSIEQFGFRVPKEGQSPYKIFERVLKPIGYDENNDIIYEYDNSVTFLKRTEGITELEKEEARYV